jgi:hypothetical protein
MVNKGKTLITFITACCECKKLLGIETHEREIDKVERPVNISHGYCEPCFEAHCERERQPV